MCFGGLGLFLGIIGFGTDAMSQGPLLSYHLVTAGFGSALGCVGLLVFGRRSPDVPFVLLPVLLGTVALLLPFESNPVAGWLAMVLGKTVDVWALVLMTAVLGELLRMHAGEPTQALRPMSGSLTLAALLLLAGILVGGILMSVVGRDATAMALVAVSLVYVTMLALGVSAQRRSQSNYIIVRNPQDVARIAAAQAQAIAREFPALSPRELDVLRLLLQHQTIDRMAEELGISRNTVKSHIAHLYEKTGLNSRQQLAGPGGDEDRAAVGRRRRGVAPSCSRYWRNWGGRGRGMRGGWVAALRGCTLGQDRDFLDRLALWAGPLGRDRDFLDRFCGWIEGGCGEVAGRRVVLSRSRSGSTGIGRENGNPVHGTSPRPEIGRENRDLVHGISPARQIGLGGCGCALAQAAPVAVPAPALWGGGETSSRQNRPICQGLPNASRA